MKGGVDVRRAGFQAKENETERIRNETGGRITGAGEYDVGSSGAKTSVSPGKQRQQPLQVITEKPPIGRFDAPFGEIGGSGGVGGVGKVGGAQERRR